MPPSLKKRPIKTDIEIFKNVDINVYCTLKTNNCITSATW